MKRDEALACLQAHAAELKKLGVLRLFMFGSTAREEAREGSDVDLFFDYDKETLGLFQLMDVKEFTSGLLGCKVDIMTRDSIHRSLRQDIESSALRVF